MNNNETLKKMRDMRLSGMADAFSAQLSDRLVYDQIPAEDRIGMLVDAEADKRRNAKLIRLLRDARLRFPEACPEEIIYEPARHLDKSMLSTYFSCRFIEDGIDIAILGPTGSGKSFLANAIAVAAVKRFHSARYMRTPELLCEFKVARETGRYEKTLARYRKYQLLILDDFLLNTATKEETRDLYELIEGRNMRVSTIYCSQFSEAGWLERLGGGTSAEGIVDRITNSSYKIILDGDVNMREMTSKVKR